MNRKWNLFKKNKINKTDSHGTTLVDEEIQFQPTTDVNSQWKGNSLKPSATKPTRGHQSGEEGHVTKENEYENSEVARGVVRSRGELLPVDTRSVVPRTSPTVTKKLIKPGNKNATMLIPSSDASSSMSISDEYVEPFDSVKRDNKAMDGYIEPYEAQQMYHELTQNSDAAKSSKSKIYDESWDKSKQKDKDYEEPWDKTNTLPYKDNNNINHGSSDSLSALRGKQKMVFVPSQQRSPSSSPMLDRRLIRPPDTHTRRQERVVDHRLIKVEPSFDEIRRSNSRNTGSSGTNSPISKHNSPNHSPVNTLIVTNEVVDLRRASSPLVQPMNVSLYRLSKAKSRSLDIRSKQGLSALRGEGGIPKSSSDDHLVQSAQVTVPTNKSLDGVSEYEEPWDTETTLTQGNPHISHSRSRSYEISSVPHLNRHSKSHSFDNQDPGDDYEHPWDKPNIPKVHLESMQRFQHRQLELHPSEAIADKDFDPLLPLTKQGWYHGAITRDEANMRLSREVPGSYLVRNSESTANNYSLSLRTRSTTIHMVISSTRDGFWILGEFSAPFHSVPEMIAFYSTHRLKINDTQNISLKYPITEDYL
ncbi:uncharacterized protein LOC100182710 [Ciona intestinalis]